MTKGRLRYRRTAKSPGHGLAIPPIPDVAAAARPQLRGRNVARSRAAIAPCAYRAAGPRPEAVQPFVHATRCHESGG